MMRGLVLVLEASTADASVALLRDGALVTEEVIPSRDPVTRARTEGLVPVAARLLAAAHAEASQLSAVICGAGPGGFTSLRSAAAVAKGLCSALRLPLYAVSTMELLVASAALGAGQYHVALDAGRDESFTSTVELLDDRVVESTPVTIVPRPELIARARAAQTPLVGPGYDVDVSPRASAVVSLLDRLARQGPVDLDRWEPAYGRLAEAQVKWEAAHGRPLPV